MLCRVLQPAPPAHCVAVTTAPPASSYSLELLHGCCRSTGRASRVKGAARRNVGPCGALSLVVAQIALALWIVISIAFFAMLSPLRAFVLTYVIGLLVLPVEMQTPTGWIGSIAFSTALRIDKYTACNIAALLGTIMFAPHVLRRYRFDWLDAFYLFIPVCIFITSVVNNIGVKDGFSNAFASLRIWAPLIFLSKAHIQSVGDLLVVLRAMIAGAFVYAMVAVLEFRLSPWLHRALYGYFQHDFAQFARYDRFRPVGFLRHAIEMSFFMGSMAALAVWLWIKGLLRPLWGFVPAPLVVFVLLIGLACTLTFSGYAVFLLAMTVMLLFHFVPRRWVLVIVPLLAIAWMIGRYAGVLEARILIDTATMLDPSRAESIQYRFESEQIHLRAANSHLVFGRGGLFGMVRNEQGGVVKAVDAFWLIQLTFFGLAGLALWLAVWTSPILLLLANWRLTTGPTRALLAAVCVLVGIQLADFLFNSFPSPFLMMLIAGSFGVVHAIRDYHAAIPAAQRLYGSAPAPGGAA